MLKFENCMIENGDFTLSADLSVALGSKTAVIGPSGAGKSTLLEGLAGFRDLARGSITWNGNAISTLHPGDRPVTMLFQDGNLFPHMTVLQNVGLGATPNGRLSDADREVIHNALVRVGLNAFEGRKPAELSGGQRSRVALARALVQRRDILLLDEPFAALGPALKAEMLDLVAELVDEAGLTLLMISHDPDDARRITQHAILVSDSVASAPQDTNDLLNNPPEALRDYLG